MIHLSKKLTLFVLLIFVTMIFIFFIWINHPIKEESSEQKTLISSLLNPESIPLSPLLLSLRTSYLINGKKLPKLSLTNYKGKDTIISCVGKKTIILLYSELSCNSCVDSLLKSCEILYQHKKGNAVFGIVQSSNIGYVRRFARINNLIFTLYWDQKKYFTNSFKILSLPTILLVDENGIIINSFAINPSVRALTPIFIESALEWVKI